MTSASLWVQGARPRTLGAAVAPVLVGTSAAVAEADGVIWWRSGCALLVALALQVGVNYANDYSDGVRGTDKDRKGPVRLTATGLATPGAVKRAAFLSFGVAAVAGLVLSLVVNPWLLLVGVAAIGAAWLYTGGPKPYGYLGSRRAHGARVLRLRGDGRLRVRAGEGRPGRGVVGLARRRSAGVRDPARQQRARRPDRLGHRQAHARGAAGRDDRASACSSRATSGRSRRW